VSRRHEGSAGEFLRYLDHQRGASRHTLRSYAADLADFNAFLAREKVGGLAAADARAIRGWLASLHDGSWRDPPSPQARHGEELLKYLARRGAVELNAARQIRSPKLPKRLPSFCPRRIEEPPRRRGGRLAGRTP
jgi:integrase/recombinase XerC